MFGFSLTKLVVLIVVVGLVLVLFRFIGQRTAVPTAARAKLPPAGALEHNWLKERWIPEGQ